MTDVQKAEVVMPVTVVRQEIGGLLFCLYTLLFGLRKFLATSNG